MEKHSGREESDSQRLQDDLTIIYQNHVLDKPSRLAPFLAILRNLKPAIRGSGRLSQWWDRLAIPILNKLGEEKGLAEEARNALLAILVYDEDEEDADSVATSAAISENLLEIYLQKHALASEEFDEEARFVEGQLQKILVAFGKKRPKAFLTTLDKFFVKKEHRIEVLGLLCEFMGHQPPHLYLLLQTPLFGNLLKCLQTDTSTRAISLAMTALIMFLPHIPTSLAKHLPAMFNIFSRMLFWDRERRALSEPIVDDIDDNENEIPIRSTNGDWDKLSFLLDSEDENVPELTHYFTFLYGLYPLNLMSYIRKPQKYLRHASFPGADDLDVEPTEMRQRSEAFRRVHLLHPNFYEMTIEDELTNNHRWMKSEAADVVAECMALYSPGEEEHSYASRSRAPGTYKKAEDNADIPNELLQEELDALTPYQSRHTSWRNTRSTAVASPVPCNLPGLHRKVSQTSQSMPSIPDSPTIQATERLNGPDSPTLPPHILSSPPSHLLQDMLSSAKSMKTSSLYQTLTNDSVVSLADSTNPDTSFHVDAYLQSLSREHPVNRSPSLRPTHHDPSLRAAYQRREIQLLRNDLTFERYLKRQHLSHIGLLRRKQIREARVEAETQNLINSNRSLRTKLEDAKKNMLQLKKETEKSKAHARKWEADLTSKLRILREDQKKWTKEREELNFEVTKLSRDTARLRDLVVSAESKELLSQQKMQSIASSLDELERLRGEVDKLTRSLRTFEAAECQAAQDKAREEAALREVDILKMQLRARDEELLKSASAFENELRDARKGAGDAILGRTRSGIPQEVFDAGLEASRKRIQEMKNAHDHLLGRFNQLAHSYVAVREELDRQRHVKDNDDEEDEQPALLSGRPRVDKIDTRTRSPSPMAAAFQRRRNHTLDANFESPTHLIGVASQAGHSTTNSPTEMRSPVNRGRTESSIQGLGTAAEGVAAAYYYGGGKGSIGSGDEHSLDALGRPKIKPQSDIRVYGRGKLPPFSVCLTFD